MKAQSNIPINNALTNIISPIGLIFKRDSVFIGENIGKIYGIVKYPSEISYGWLSRITNIPGTIVSITFIPIDSSEFLEALNKNISQKRAEEEIKSRDRLASQRAKKSADDGENLLIRIDQEGETVGMLSILIMPIATDAGIFKKITRKVMSICAVLKCKIRLLAHLQESAFKHISPMYIPQQDIGKVVDRIGPLSAYIGGFPNGSSGYNDRIGYYLGRDSSGNPVIIDPWLRGGDRTNTNFVVMGIPGIGKSTVIKLLLLLEYMRGTRIIIIDPEREYEEMCKILGGDWINAGGGSEGKINPLEIRPIPRDEGEEDVYKDEGNGIGDMALYIKHLEIFFSLYMKNLSNIQMAILKDCLIQLYIKNNITWNTDITLLESEDFPILSDLYDLLVKKAEEMEKTRKEADDNVYNTLAILLKDLAEGSDRALWNGHTTVKASSRCVCLDTLDLQNTGDNIKRTQYFNILSWAWREMSKDRNEKVLLVCDEGYLMIDPNVPQSLVFLRNAEKRARKYEAGVAVVSHSVVDFLDPSIKMYGQAILDTPCFKIIFGTDGQNLQETKKLYDLKDTEEELLSAKRRGHALLTAGSKRMHVHFDISPNKFKYFGKAGGR